ncbi:hypothetical protein ABKN59_002621 [Abortiporus biennis]
MSRPRSNSMTDAFRMRSQLRILPGEGWPTSDIINAATHVHQRTEQFITELPRLSEQDVVAMHLEDSSCPICITPFLAILSEEEMAIAMDSPAHPIEELGVTKLRICNHVFCRKDIQQWVRQGNNTCPSCRRPLIEPIHEAITPTRDNINNILRGMGVAMFAAGERESLVQRGAIPLPTDIHEPEQDSESETNTRADPDDRSEFSSMYS